MSDDRALFWFLGFLTGVGLTMFIGGLILRVMA